MESPIVPALPLAALALSLVASFATGAETPSAIAAGYAAQAGTPPSAARGEQFFTTRHAGDWSCASCHGTPPTATGRHAATGKTIAPLAPAFNPDRFTDVAKVEKWFARNCKDVAGRACSAGEKADVLAWLMTLKK